MRFLTFDQVAAYFRSASVAIVGSAPSCTENDPGFVDSHDIVVRVNNYRIGRGQGNRTDVHYSFYGNSIKKASGELAADGVRMCMCKLPNSKPLSSDWHEQNGKPEGVNYRYIYRNRAAWWFCDTFVPNDARFLAKFELLGKHQPTTGFAAILDVLECAPRSVFLTGFDFFASKMHNVDEPWKEKNTGDPICHRPDLEQAWLRENSDRYPLTFDAKLTALLGERVAA